jgi:riboflavin-specific deaminase-like protein
MNRPQVIVNFAMTADGKVSTRNWTPSGFGSAADRKRLREIRARADALLVGRKTAEIDNMSLLISQPELRQKRKAIGKPESPLRVLISGRGRIRPDMKMFSLMRSPILIFTGIAPSRGMQKQFPKNVIFHVLEKFSVPSILSCLRRQYDVRTIVCEGGPTLMRTLLEAGAVTEVNLTIVPLIFGGFEAPSLSGIPGNFFSKPIDFRLKTMEIRNGECFLTYGTIK